MPSEGEPIHRLNRLDQNLKRLSSVRLLQLRHLGIDLGRNDPPVQPGAGDERAIEFDAKPRAETRGVANCPPNAFAGRFEYNSLLDLIRVHVQSPRSN